MNKQIIICTAMAFALSITASARELKSFLGVKFGATAAENKLSGPDEDGDYTFLPNGKTPNDAIDYYAFVTNSSKRVYSVTMNHTCLAPQVNGLMKEYVKLFQGYNEAWSVLSLAEKKEQLDSINEGLSKIGLSVASKDFNVWTFKNAKGEVCQLMTLYVFRQGISATIVATVTDIKLSALDDAETTCDASKTLAE